MEEYHPKLFRAYLESEPKKYDMPASVGKDVVEVSALNPEVKSVTIYKYPNEHSVVLEGKNLWFCHKVLLGENDAIVDIRSSIQTNTGCSIQFKYQPTEKSDPLLTSDVIQVKLHSRFANPIGEQIPVEQVSIRVYVLMGRERSHCYL